MTCSHELTDTLTVEGEITFNSFGAVETLRASRLRARFNCCAIARTLTFEYLLRYQRKQILGDLVGA
jgi:hypothetical protein